MSVRAAWAASPLARNAAMLLAAAVPCVASGWLTTTSLQQDFAAFFTAARARALHLDPYVNHLGTPGGPWDGVAVYRHSRFLYPPIVAELFRPLAALPFVWAKTLFTAASLLALVLGLCVVAGDPSLATPGAGRRQPNLAVTLALAAVWPPVFAAVERGQIDLLLLPMLAAAWRWRRHAAVAGLALGSCALGKPLVLGILPVLLGARRWRWAAATVGALGLYGAASVAVSGRDLCAEYLTDVLPRAALYGEGGPEDWLLDDDTLAKVSADLANGVARIDGHGRAFAQGIGEFGRNASLPRLLSGHRPPSPAVAFAVGLVGTAALAWTARRRSASPVWYWGGLLLGVIVAPVSWVMSLVWATPLFLWVRVASGAGSGGGLAAASRNSGRAFGVALTVMFVGGFAGLVAPGAWPLVGAAGVAAALAVPAPAVPAPEDEAVW